MGPETTQNAAPMAAPMTSGDGQKHFWEGAILGIIIGIVIGGGAYIGYEKYMPQQSQPAKNPQQSLVTAQQQLSQTLANLKQYENASAQLKAQLPGSAMATTSATTTTATSTKSR